MMLGCAMNLGWAERIAKTSSAGVPTERGVIWRESTRLLSGSSAGKKTKCSWSLSLSPAVRG